MPAHAGEARGEGHPTPALRELEPLGAAGAAARRLVSTQQRTGLRRCSLLTAAASARIPHLGGQLPPAFSRHFRRERVHGRRTTTPTLPRAAGPLVPSRFRSFASLPRLGRFVLGISRSAVQSEPLTCWEVDADASGLRGVATASHVTARWRRRGSWFWVVASEEPRRFLLSGRRGRSARLVPAAARSPALGVCPGRGCCWHGGLGGVPVIPLQVSCVGRPEGGHPASPASCACGVREAAAARPGGAAPVRGCGRASARECERQRPTPEGAKTTAGPRLPLPGACFLLAAAVAPALPCFLSMLSRYIWKYDQRP